MTGRVINVLIVDDDKIFVEAFMRRFGLSFTYNAQYAQSVKEAQEKLKTGEFEVVILDMVMPSGPLDELITDRGKATGIALAREAKAYRNDVRTFLLTNLSEFRLSAFHRTELNIEDLLKKTDTTPEHLMKLLDKSFSIRSFTPASFIVHGHDVNLLSDIKSIIMDEFSWQEPVILQEKSSRGMTIIEKFEYYASGIDVAFVLLSPDDIGSTKDKMSDEQFRARQNVIFELGYFYAKLRRTSGRVIAIKSGPVEIPSDLSGVVYIQGNDRADLAGKLRAELTEYLT